MGTLQRLKKLSKNYKVVIPTTIFDETAPFELVQKIKMEVKTKMAEEFGGYTESAGIGGYVSSNGELIEEQVFVIESFYKHDNDKLIIGIAEKIKADMKQESVLIEKNGKKYFL